MSQGFLHHNGSGPLLVSVPHDGRRLTTEIRARMSPAGLDLPDTDWHVAELYAFVRELGASLIVAEYSRYVVDLNRSASDEALYEGQLATGLCPEQTFAGQQIYVAGCAVDSTECGSRIVSYWRPYHNRLKRVLTELRAKHGYALLWDAHSILSDVPRLFAGRLPELSLGSFDERSCDQEIAADVVTVAEQSPFTSAVNARFKGGYITRHYGDPDEHIHALQLEIAQRAYMDENTRTYDAEKARQLKATLERMLRSFLAAAARRYQ